MSDYAIIGGGVVGLSVAWGLLQRGKSVTIIDGSDGAHRASRGNFGLIWVQGKGLSFVPYARWTRGSADLWQEHAETLEAATGRKLNRERRGGWEFHFSEESLERMAQDYAGLRDQLGGDYPFEVLGHNAVRAEEPEIGPGVVGAVLHHEDGHVNPLQLLRALSDAVRLHGAKVLTDVEVKGLSKPGDFRLVLSDGREIEASKVVLAAGLGAAKLGPMLGFKAPVRPQRGQVLITEKLAPMMHRPSVIARQVDEGGVQIGATNEEVGFDDQTTRRGLRDLAAEAVAAYPALARAQLVRSWGALRVMSPDGLPIYDESPSMPGAYLVTCHSGITLSAAHAMRLSDWLEGRGDAPDLEVFGEARFS